MVYFSLLVLLSNFLIKGTTTQLQDKYYERLTEKGFDLERGIKGSDAEHLKTTIKDYDDYDKEYDKSDGFDMSR